MEMREELEEEETLFLRWIWRQGFAGLELAATFLPQPPSDAAVYVHCWDLSRTASHAGPNDQGSHGQVKAGRGRKRATALTCTHSLFSSFRAPILGRLFADEGGKAPARNCPKFATRVGSGFSGRNLGVSDDEEAQPRLS